MPNYLNGKIYKIHSPSLNLTYIGSTTTSLKERLDKHKYHNTSCSKQIMKSNDYEITLVENYPCTSKYELEMRETEHIQNNVCVNVALPPCALVPNKKSYKEHYEKMRPMMSKWSLSKV
jgi:hypothetical protein